MGMTTNDYANYMVRNSSQFMYWRSVVHWQALISYAKAIDVSVSGIIELSIADHPIVCTHFAAFMLSRFKSKQVYSKVVGLDSLSQQAA